MLSRRDRGLDNLAVFAGPPSLPADAGEEGRLARCSASYVAFCRNRMRF